MKKYLLSGCVVLILVVFIIFDHKKTPAVVSTVPASTSTDINTQQTSTTPSAGGSQPMSTPSSTPVTTPKTSADLYKDGEYTGQAADAFYGTIQVKAIISGGKITDVQFLQYPNDRGESVQISQQAMPKLTAEAIQSQSANVDVVSGATQDSEAFQQSLASALSQAKS